MRTPLLLLALAGCRSTPTVTNGTPDAAPPAALVEVGGRSMAPSAPEAGAPMSVDERVATRTYLAAIAEGRKATRAKRYDAAQDAFGRALAARPGDPRAHAERGYAALLAGKLDAADADLDRALKGGLDKELEASVHFNRGLVLEKRGDAERAAIAFATADQIQSTPARRAKANGRAYCSADATDAVMDIKVYEGWEQLRDAIDPIKDRGTARKSVCVSSFQHDGENADETVCNGAPPWRVAHHYLMYTWDEWWLHPFGKSIVAVHGGRSGSRPALCMTSPSYEASYEGGLVIAKATFHGSEAEIDDSAAPDPEAPPRCRDVPGWDETTWFDPATDKRLLTIRVREGGARPRVDVAPHEIRVQGAGCDRTVAR